MAVETNIHSFWAAVQAAKGTAATAPSTAGTGVRFRLADQGNIATERTDGEGPFSDLSVYGDAQDYVQTIVGSGTPPFHSTPDELAWMLWYFNGQESVSAGGSGSGSGSGSGDGDPKNVHESTPTASLKYATFYKRVGTSVIERERYIDSVASQLEITAGSGQHILRMTPTIVSLDPGEKIAVDPTLTLPPAEDYPAFLWTESEGALEVNSSVITGPTQYTLTFNKNLEPTYGNSSRPVHLQPGTPQITVSCAMALDDDAYQLAQKILYGTTSPAPGAKPVVFVGERGAFHVVHTQKDSGGVLTGNVADLEVPGVKWDPPSAVVVPNPQGGGGTLELSGRMRKVLNRPEWVGKVTCDAAQFTA